MKQKQKTKLTFRDPSPLWSDTIQKKTKQNIYIREKIERTQVIQGKTVEYNAIQYNESEKPTKTNTNCRMPINASNKTP